MPSGGTSVNRRRVLALALALPGLVLGLSLEGCFWKYGFAGGGLPQHVRTVAVVPFENQTAVPELTRELSDAVRTAMLDRLGMRDATEEKADAVVRGTITRYDPDAPVAFSADPTRATQVRRRLQIVLDIEIFDQVANKVLYTRKGIMAEGEYSDRADVVARKQAIDRIVSDILDGAQSQW